MATREIVCVVCPRGCLITVEGEGDRIDRISGFTCPRGEAYARQEFTAPMRTLTSTVRAEGYVGPVISVRSKAPIPKEKLLPAMAVLRNVTVTAPFTMGRVVVEDILGTGVDIVLTNNDQK